MNGLIKKRRLDIQWFECVEYKQSGNLGDYVAVVSMLFNPLSRSFAESVIVFLVCGLIYGLASAFDS